MKKQYSRKFGQWRVTVTRDKVSVVGDWQSNYGTVYGLRYDAFGYRRFYGMASSVGLTSKVRNYIEESVEKIYAGEEEA